MECVETHRNKGALREKGALQNMHISLFLMTCQLMHSLKELLESRKVGAAFGSLAPESIYLFISSLNIHLASLKQLPQSLEFMDIGQVQETSCPFNSGP